jgi:ribose transport system substrate-binding protein
LEFLRRHPKEKHILIAAANDTSAIGAISAVKELGRTKHVAVVGQDFLEEMKTEMERPGSPAIGSVSHEVATYGERLVELGLALLRGETVPPYNYVAHRAVKASWVAYPSEENTVLTTPRNLERDGARTPRRSKAVK